MCSSSSGMNHRLPFVTIATVDNDYDRVSNLDRDGVFRLNIGISKTTFDRLLPGADHPPADYTSLDVFLPHPDYAKQHFVCILNPSADNTDAATQLILEAYSIAAARFRRLQ